MWVGAVLGFIISVVCCAIVMVVSGSAPSDEHEYDWEVRGACQMSRVNTFGGVLLQSANEGAPFTEVLYRCRDCREVVTEPLEGHWTYDQLREDKAENGRDQGGADGDTVASGDNPDGATGHSNN